MMKVVVVGGGAAGMFAAINIKFFVPQIDVTILEAAPQPLAKVRVSGGGRCNLTNSFAAGMPLSKIYPRGEKLMRNALRFFDHTDAYNWFEDQGVELVTQDDHCVFPASQDSGQIVDTFLRLCHEHSIDLQCSKRVESIRKEGDVFYIDVQGAAQTIECDIVVATTGGSPKMDALSLYSQLPLRFKDPVPSLFSFNIPSDPITELMGGVVENASVRLKGSRMMGSGALLITHWGISGPAVLRLSSYAARRLYEQHYKAQVLINWAGEASPEQVLRDILELKAENARKLVGSARPYALSARIWSHILHRADISQERRFVELGSKGINRIVATLIGDEYTIDGRSQHKEEFVTCGGISAGCVNPTTMESRDCENLFLAGEVLDVDAITGGFNLQAAWSMAYVAAQTIRDIYFEKQG